MRVWLSFFISLNLLAAPKGSHLASQTSDGSRPVADSSHEALESTDLEMYLQLLDEREKQLISINQSLLEEADYSFVKIPLFMIKAGIDGYLLGRMMNTGSATTTTIAGAAASKAVQKTLESKIKNWIAQGGVEKLKRLGFNLTLLGIVTTNDTALVKGYQWEYRIPIYGTARAAYAWSDQLMKSPELIEKNGNEIFAIRKEKHRIRSILNHVPFGHEQN